MGMFAVGTDPMEVLRNDGLFRGAFRLYVNAMDQADVNNAQRVQRRTGVNPQQALRYAKGLREAIEGVAGSIGTRVNPLRRAPKMTPAIRNKKTGAVIPAPNVRGGDVTHPDAWLSLPEPRPKWSDIETGYMNSAGKFIDRNSFVHHLLDDLGVAPGQPATGDFGELYSGIESISYKNFERFWNKLSPEERTRFFDRAAEFKAKKGHLPRSRYGAAGVESMESPYGNAVEQATFDFPLEFKAPEEFTYEQFRNLLGRILW